jgi:hypothetical protein
MFDGYGGMLGALRGGWTKAPSPDDYAAGAAGADVIDLGASSVVSIGLPNLRAQVE